MSLTNLLTSPDVRAKFKEAFAKPSFRIYRPMLVQPLTNHPQWVGTAFDYLFRFQCERVNRDVVTTGPWVAQESLEILARKRKRSRTKWLACLHETARSVVEQARLAHDRFLQAGHFSDEIVSLAVRLAQLDTICRAHKHDIQAGNTEYMEAKYDELNAPLEMEIVHDLCALLEKINWSLFKARRICILNPTFGKASTLVGGADADVLIDDTLIDLKTVKSLELTRPIFDQLIGYYLLYRIGGIAAAKAKAQQKASIKELGIYFSRYAYLHVIPVDEVINDRALSSVLTWFKKRSMLA